MPVALSCPLTPLLNALFFLTSPPFASHVFLFPLNDSMSCHKVAYGGGERGCLWELEHLPGGYTTEEFVSPSPVMVNLNCQLDCFDKHLG